MSVTPECAVEGECDTCCGCFDFEDKEFSVKRGDYAPLMEKVSHHLQQAQVNPSSSDDCVACVSGPLASLEKLLI